MTERFLASLCFGILLTSFGFAEETPSPEDQSEEAPTSIFDQKIGDVGVVLEAEGTWTTRLTAGWGQGFGSSGSLPALGYPGMEKGVVFAQKPDFSLTLRLLERYYLQVIYGGTLEDRFFLVGYEGREGELVQWAKVGNASFSVPSRAGQALAEGRPGAPAVGMVAVAGPVTLEALGRYEDGTREVRMFRGFQDTRLAQVPLDRWFRGRFFRLPTTGSSGVVILVSDASGNLGASGRRYRLATGSEAVVESGGVVRLDRSATKRFLVTWPNAGSWANPATRLLGWKATQETDPALGSGPWYVLIQPGEPSAFEIRNRYPVDLGVEEPIVLRDRDTGLPVGGYTVGQAASQDWFEVSGPEEAPFFASLPALYPGSASPPPAEATLPWVFSLPGTAAGKNFALGDDVVKDSIVVVRNGIPTTAFTLNGGDLTLDVPVYDTDQIEISYQRKKTGQKASDLVLWQAGRWEWDVDQGWEWALQGRWNMEQGRYTTEDLQSPGRVAASVSYQGSGGDWSWRLGLTGGALLADSTGHRRLYGFAENGTQASLDGNALRPSALPETLGLGLSEANRGHVVFRNYWSNDPLTGKPQVASWDRTTPAEPSVTDGWIGPYLVRGDGIRSDRLAVLESTLTTGQWVGLQTYLDQGKSRNLLGATAVTLNLRIPQGASGSRLFFQAGTLSDNWDGTGSLRKIEYRSFPALAFTDQNRGSRYFPIPEDSSWGNDADGDGSAGLDGALVTRELTPLLQPLSGDWQTVRLVLSDAERQKLASATGWRLVVVQQTPGPDSRTVLAGPVVFEGSGWTVQTDPSALPNSSVNPVEQADPSDKDRRWLRVDWKNRPSWTIEGRHPGLRPASYRTLAFRYRLDAVSPGTTDLVLAVTGADGRGLRVRWTPTGPGWVQGRVNLVEKTLTLDGLKAGTVSIDPGTSVWDRLTLTKAGTAADGQLLLAEVEAVDPVWEPLGSTSASATWTQSGAWPSPEWPLVSGLVWQSTTDYSGLTADSMAWKGQSTLGGTLGPIQGQAEASFVRTASGQEGHGAYKATLPVGPSEGPRVEWTDQFSDRGLRAETLVINLVGLGTWEALAKAEGPPVSLNQEYVLGWKTTAPAGKASVSAGWTQTSPKALPLSGFAQTWTESWNWLAPPPETAAFYLLQAGGEGEFSVGPWSPGASFQNRVSQSRGSAVKWTTWGDWKLKAPFQSPGDESWTLTPWVAKSLESVFSGTPLWTPFESAQKAAQKLWTPPGSLGSLPFVELNGQEPWTSEDGLQSGKVISTGALDWERLAQSSWTDLLIPSAAGTKVSTVLGRESEAGYHSLAWTNQFQVKALNVFGALGSLPVFPWYRTDVWTWSTAETWGTGTRDSDHYLETAVSASAQIVLEKDETWSLPVTYQGRWGTAVTQSVKTQPTWSIRGPANLPFELPRWLSPSAFRRQWVQDLGLTLLLGWPGPAPVVQDLLVVWKGRFLLSEKSELALTTRWGQQWQEKVTVVALEAALDLVLSF